MVGLKAPEFLRALHLTLASFLNVVASFLYVVASKFDFALLNGK